MDYSVVATSEIVTQSEWVTTEPVLQ